MINLSKKNIKQSDAVEGSLSAIISVFSNAVTQLAALQETASDAIKREENKIMEAQMEINSLQESLEKISSVKDNISKMINPAI